MCRLLDEVEREERVLTPASNIIRQSRRGSSRHYEGVGHYATKSNRAGIIESSICDEVDDRCASRPVTKRCPDDKRIRVVDQTDDLTHMVENILVVVRHRLTVHPMVHRSATNAEEPRELVPRES